MEASDGSIGIICPNIPILSVSSFKSGNSVLYIKYYLKALYCEKINLTIHDKSVLSYICPKEVKSSSDQNENKTLFLTSFLMIFDLK